MLPKHSENILMIQIKISEQAFGCKTKTLAFINISFKTFVFFIT